MPKIQCIPLLIILIIADDKEGNKTMDNQQIRNFYLSKEYVPTPETDRLIAGGYMQKSDGYIEYAKECGVEPTQHWHLIHSWSDRSSEHEQFRWPIQCGELYVWMAEVAGVSGVGEVVDAMLQAPDDRKRGNKLAYHTLFDKIAKRVEGATR